MKMVSLFVISKIVSIISKIIRGIPRNISVKIRWCNSDIILYFRKTLEKQN